MLSHKVEVANRVNLGFNDRNGKCQGSDKVGVEIAN